jgi:hypothetical protein
MRKGTLFVSALLTTFMLAVMVGAVSAYQKIVKNTSPAVKPVQAAGVEAVSEPLTAPQAPAFTAEQAAALAAQVLGHTDLFSVETTMLNGASVYLVTFSSGDLVYVSPQGQIVSISKIVPVVLSAPSSQGQRRAREDNSGSSHVEEGHPEESHEEDHGGEGY